MDQSIKSVTEHQQAKGARITDYLKSWPQYLLPQHALSNAMYALTRSKTSWWKKAFINWFIRQYNVDMSEAIETSPDTYACFNDFFTRALKPEARPICEAANALACPVDGFVSQSGKIERGRIFQAKGQDYSLDELLAGHDEWATSFTDGHFATLYLSPSDYHRIHMPIAGTLSDMTYVPGRLFSVSPATTRAIPRLFARNERVIAHFETELGPMALILVGAIFVGSMETVWHGMVTPPHGGSINHWNYKSNPSGLSDALVSSGSKAQQMIQLGKGEELGRFNMGSTVILLFPPNCVNWNNLQSGQPVRMGQQIATLV
jgi:phosphatidylserine decarboxylase